MSHRARLTVDGEGAVGLYSEFEGEKPRARDWLDLEKDAKAPVSESLCSPY